MQVSADLAVFAHAVGLWQDHPTLVLVDTAVLAWASPASPLCCRLSACVVKKTFIKPSHLLEPLEAAGSGPLLGQRAGQGIPTEVQGF